ncbi:MAG: low molecular weight phosphotyrosine protein phosphatase [Verrucomicrobiaceae bacterium]|nr:low molecular weight phosphotyrosine protein phosphatase [Verrucomicrobiaceae bacterium]
MSSEFRLLFVCLGNICRSPAAEGVMRHFVEENGLASSVHIDSAGTAGWHTGKRADERMRAAALARGYDLASRARQLKAEDLLSFDLVLVMDEENLRDARALDPQSLYTEKVKLFCDFCTDHSERQVPDPYYGGEEGFEKVLDLLEDGCRNLITFVKRPRV